MHAVNVNLIIFLLEKSLLNFLPSYFPMDIIFSWMQFFTAGGNFIHFWNAFKHYFLDCAYSTFNSGFTTTHLHTPPPTHKLGSRYSGNDLWVPEIAWVPVHFGSIFLCLINSQKSQVDKISHVPNCHFPQSERCRFLYNQWYIRIVTSSSV